MKRCPHSALLPTSELTFKLDVPQVLWEVMEGHFQPLVQLLGKLPDHLS